MKIATTETVGTYIVSSASCQPSFVTVMVLSERYMVHRGEMPILSQASVINQVRGISTKQRKFQNLNNVLYKQVQTHP